jgi:hypothetical protein
MKTLDEMVHYICADEWYEAFWSNKCEDEHAAVILATVFSTTSSIVMTQIRAYRKIIIDKRKTQSQANRRSTGERRILQAANKRIFQDRRKA